MCATFGTVATSAAESAARTIRTKVILVHQGRSDLSGYRTIEDIATTDRLVFILLGSGRATLTITDGDETGDTITANGTLTGGQQTTFHATATSPNQIVQWLSTTIVGVLTVDISYSDVINGLPAGYIYRLEF
jgi:hypothetical protein